MRGAKLSISNKKGEDIMSGTSFAYAYFYFYYYYAS